LTKQSKHFIMKTISKSILMLAITACIGHSANAQGGRSSTTTTTTVTSGSGNGGTTTVRPNATLDGRFVGKLIALNAYEIRLLQLVQGMSRRKDLKDHAVHMLADHQQLDQQMRAYATAHGFTSMEKKDFKYDEKITKRAGQPAGLEWDKDIIEDLVDAHEDGLEIMRKERKNLSDQQLVAMVDAALPKMEAHLTMLRPLESGAKEAVRTNDTAAGNGLHMNHSDRRGVNNMGTPGGVNNNNTILNSDYSGNGRNSTNNGSDMNGNGTTNDSTNKNGTDKSKTKKVNNNRSHK
jgi:predicted outer membrane protein